MIPRRRAAQALLAPFVLAIGFFVIACAVASTGSLYRGRCTHVGLRPAASLGEGAGATVQISGDPFVCRELYPP